MNPHKTRCGTGLKLSYKWIDDPEQTIEDIADNLAAKFAGDALAEGAIKSSHKEKYEDDLFGFFLDKLELLCLGNSINGVIDVPLLCRREKLPIFEHRWRYSTTLYKTGLPPGRKTLQIRHYAGEPEIVPDLLLGLVVHMKPWPHENDEIVHDEQDKYIKEAIRLYKTSDYF